LTGWQVLLAVGVHPFDTLQGWQFVFGFGAGLALETALVQGAASSGSDNLTRPSASTANDARSGMGGIASGDMVRCF